MAPVVVDREKKERRIARAALKLFSKKGYRATNVGRIAEEAGVGKGTLYEYFSTKADIFLAAAKEWIEQFQKQFETRLSEIQDPIKQLHAIARMNVELVDPLDPADARMTVEVIRQGILEDGILYGRRYEMRDMMLGMQKLVEQILLNGISKKIFKPEIARDASTIAANFLGYLDGIMLHSILSENHLQLKDKVDLFMATLIRELVADPCEKNGTCE